jgi:hypothetical protein
MDESIQRLAEGDHPINTWQYKIAEELKQAVERGYILIKFTETHGGTELRSRLDKTSTELGNADFEQAADTIQVVGNLILNDIKVRGVAGV